LAARRLRGVRFGRVRRQPLPVRIEDIPSREEPIMDNVYMPLQLAPASLSQPILPNWSFNLFNVNLGASSNPAIEQEVLQTVGSYGRQIGHLAEALELVIDKLKLLERKDLSQTDRDTLQVFLGDVSAVRKIKASQT
jgi:hypothetical protein